MRELDLVTGEIIERGIQAELILDSTPSGGKK